MQQLLSALTTGEISKIRENGATTGVGVLATYAYNALGNRSSLTFGNGAIETYGHDAVARLSSLTNDLTGTVNDLTKTFGYNPASGLASETRSNDSYAWNGSVNVNRSYTPNSLNQYASVAGTSFSYDTNGNLTSDGANSYSYTSENRLKAATVGGVSSTLYYDPLGRLSEYDNTTSTRFMSDGPEVAVEVDGSGNVLRRYVRGDNPDEVLVWYEGSGTTNRRFLSSDERGSIVSATDSSGNLVGINSYDEYGIPASANIGRFQYTGQMYLPELGMYDYKARMYSTTLGRFMQTDPIGYGDGMNWYAYTHNDPVNGSDPSGLSKWAGWTSTICHGASLCGDGSYLNFALWHDAAAGGTLEGGDSDGSTLSCTTTSASTSAPAPASGGSGSDNSIIVTGVIPHTTCTSTGHSGGTSLVNAVFGHSNQQSTIAVIAAGQPYNSKDPTDQSKDWCGGSGVTSVVPDHAGSSYIGGACENHDDCYSSSGTSESECNIWLYRDILRECMYNGGSEAKCTTYAYVYYLNVSWFGWIFYKK